jgi:hypothetical protein
MKGHIRERSPGRWAIILDTHDPGTGKRKRIYRFGNTPLTCLEGKSE